MGEQFYNNLLNAKMFCGEDINKIYTTDKEIIATDGYRCIVIKDCIVPEDFNDKVILSGVNSLENMLIKAFSEEDKITCESITRMIKMNSINGKEYRIKKGEFNKKFYIKIKKDFTILQEVSKYDRVVINTNYLETALNIFTDTEELVITYPKTSISPLLIKSESKEVLVMPIKVSYGELE